MIFFSDKLKAFDLSGWQTDVCASALTISTMGHDLFLNTAFGNLIDMSSSLFAETSRFASAAMVVVVTLDRYIAVSRPISTSHWRYPQTARKVSRGRIKFWFVHFVVICSHAAQIMINDFNCGFFLNCSIDWTPMWSVRPFHVNSKFGNTFGVFWQINRKKT